MCLLNEVPDSAIWSTLRRSRSTLLACHTSCATKTRPRRTKHGPVMCRACAWTCPSHTSKSFPQYWCSRQFLVQQSVYRMVNSVVGQTSLLCYLTLCLPLVWPHCRPRENLLLDYWQQRRSVTTRHLHQKRLMCRRINAPENPTQRKRTNPLATCDGRAMTDSSI